MKSVARILCVIVAAAICFGPQARAEDTKRIGVVNVARVFESYAKVKDIEDRMKKRFEVEEAQMSKQQRELGTWEAKLKIDPRDPSKNLDLFQEIQRFELEKMKYQLTYKKLLKEVEDKKKEEMREVLNEIKKAIRDVGVSERFDLVLRAPEFEDVFDPSKVTVEEKKKEDDLVTSAAELVRKFRENPVLYYNEAVEITGKVITQLNQNYKAHAAAVQK